MVKFKEYFWLLFFVLITICLLFPLLLGKVPLPLDVLTGAYYPWLDYKWGYAVGVPFKNASLSDVFSQLYVWRGFALDQIRSGLLPLWNPHSYSGMPLLANWQSAVMYPFNLLLLISGNLPGWTLLVGLQLFLSQIFMYLFLRSINKSKVACLAGAVIFSLSGYMMTNLEYVTVGHTFLWLPAMLLLLHRILVKTQLKYLIFLPFIVYLQVTAGSVYPLVYSFVTVGLYLLYLKLIYRRLHYLAWVGSFIFFGFLLSAVQIIPTLELVGRSIRFVDPNIVEHNFGLLPIKYLLTFIAPDIFGNPATQNFFGFLGYQETSGYFGLISLLLLCTAFWLGVTGKHLRYWVYLGMTCLILAFNNPVSRLIYTLHIPLISSWYASRTLLPLTFFTAIIVSRVLSHLEKIRSRVWISAILFIALLICYAAYVSRNNAVSQHNLIVPIVLLVTFSGSLFFVRSARARLILVLLFISADLFRYYYKFTPFSASRLDFPITPVISYLQSDTGNYRVDREKNSVLPPNTVIPYRLHTPSGYDPLALKLYAEYFDSFYNRRPSQLSDQLPVFTRYSELTSYLSPALDLYGVKYLVVLRKDFEGKIRPWGQIADPQLLNSKFRQAYSDESTVVLQNTQVLPRALIYSDFVVESDPEKTLKLLKSGFDYRSQVILDRQPVALAAPSDTVGVAVITGYFPDRVEIRTRSAKLAILTLSDTNYPGWQVFVDGQKSYPLTAFGIFRAVAIPAGNHDVTFKYLPASFFTGLAISVLSLPLIFYLSRRISIKS